VASEAADRVLPVGLLPEVALLFQRQATRLEECSYMLRYRQRTLDPEPQWLANGIERSACIAHGEPLRPDQTGAPSISAIVRSIRSTASRSVAASKAKRAPAAAYRPGSVAVQPSDSA